MDVVKRTDWRTLCAAAAKEKDAAKLTCLVNQIIEAIDQTQLRSYRRTAVEDGDSAALEK